MKRNAFVKFKLYFIFLPYIDIDIIFHQNILNFFVSCVYRRIEKFSYTCLSMVLSGKNTALVMRDDGLPVFSSHCFISLILSSGPSISPLTVSSLVFMHQPVRLSLSACCFVYFRKNTPCTLPNTSNSHKYRAIIPLDFIQNDMRLISCSLNSHTGF